MKPLVIVRRTLDLIYQGAGVMAALCLVAILVLIVMQMVARWTGEVIPGVTAYAGYCMAAASFLAFANALNHGTHIRVSMLLNVMPSKARRIMETWCLLIASAMAWYLVWFAVRLVYGSYRFNFVSQEQDATPLWIPQSAVVLGAIVFAIALTDSLIHILFTGRHRIQRDMVEQSHGE